MFLDIVCWLIFLKHIESAYHQKFSPRAVRLRGLCKLYVSGWSGAGRGGSERVGGSEGILEVLRKWFPEVHEACMIQPWVPPNLEVQIGSGSSIVIASGACLRTRGSGGLGQAGASYRFAEVPKILRGRSHVAGILSFRIIRQFRRDCKFPSFPINSYLIPTPYLPALEGSSGNVTYFFWGGGGEDVSWNPPGIDSMVKQVGSKK